MLLYLLDLAGVLVFAISGALAAGRKNLDWFGVIAIATVTAIGGGTIRDVLLDRHPIFWISDPTYLGVTSLSALGVIALTRQGRRPIHDRALQIADALGLAFFAVGGTQIALSLGYDYGTVIVMAALTGTAGGVVRDLLLNEIPHILRRDIYATAAIAGASLYDLLHWLHVGRNISTVAAMALIVGLRLAAIYGKLNLPRYRVK